MSDYKITVIKKLSVIVTGLLSASLLARYLGPELRADYAIIANAAAILVLVVNFGVSNSYQPARRQNGYQVAGVYSLYAILLFCTVFIAALLFAGTFDEELTLVLVVTSFSLLRLQLQSYSLVENIRGAAYASIFGSIGEFLIILLLWVFFPAMLFLALLAILVKDVIIAAFSLHVIYSAYHVQSEAESNSVGFFKRAKTLLFKRSAGLFYKSLPIFILTVLIGVNYKIDILFLNEFEVEKKLIGMFSIGVLVAEYLWVFSDIFKDVQISRTARGGQAKDVAFANRAAIAVTLVAYIFFLLFGEMAITIFFGSEYVESFNVAALMLVANIFMIPCKVIGAYYISLNRIYIYMKIMLLVVIVNITLNIILIPIYGIYASIGSSIVSYFLAGALISYDFVRFTEVSLKDTLIIQKSELESIVKKFRSIVGWSW